MLSPEEQMKIIMKGAESVINSDELYEKLKNSYSTGIPLTVKLGLDPSAPDIHIGHAVVLRKIYQMQQLGHKTVIVIGDFTGKIGDPTGKSKTRSALSDDEVKKNAKTYCDQIFKIIDKNNTAVRFNSEWLSKLNFEEVIKLASTTTVARMLERDDFQNRYRNNMPIGVHEFFYPLMQAYDSVVIEADIELGGTDQTFNILMGRTLQKSMGQKPQIALFMPILEGLDGVEKMSKSLGNYIGVNERPEIMFKKIMEIPDNLIIKYFNLATDEHPDKIEEIKKSMELGKNPRDVKYELAKTITSTYYSEEDLKNAMDYYDSAFGKKSVPDNIPQMKIENGVSTLTEIIPSLIEMEMVKSKSEFLRLVKQNGIRINSEKIDIESIGRLLKSGDVIKIGKKKFVRFI